MSVITGVPTLLKLARAFCNFIHRNEALLRRYLNEDDEGLMDAAVIACEALETALALFTPPSNRIPTE
jgi:hypothetical protein